MIFRQLFDPTSSTYTYLIASRRGGEALLIDPVLDRIDHYVRLLSELDLRLVKALDTHIHADHVSALAALRDRTRCTTVMGANPSVDVVGMQVEEGDRIALEGIGIDVLYTPGHTDDSYSFRLGDRVFTGDTLLIRGTGRTDFQNGSPYQQYDSLFNKLLKLPDETLVYPAHDYKGDTVSTIGEERAFNPRLQVGSADEYATLMNSLNLAHPKMMDVAVPANRSIGLDQSALAAKGWALSASDLKPRLEAGGVVPVDLREAPERARAGVIPSSRHVPYDAVAEHLAPGRILRELAEEPGREVVLYCAFGERSAMAVETAREAGIGAVLHLTGGVRAWREAGGVLHPAPR